MKRIILLVAVFLCIGMVTSSHAVMTPISYPTGYSERWLDKNQGYYGYRSIIENLFGSIGNVSRVDDDLDRLWYVNEGANVRAIAKYASDSQRLYAGSEYLLSVANGNFCSLTSGSTAGISSSGAFKFYDDSGTVGGTVWSSIPGENSDGRDHMVTFRVTGLGPSANYSIGDYLIAFEDGTDMDYNDMVFLLHNVNPGNPPATPEPISMALVGLGLVGVLGLRNKK